MNKILKKLWHWISGQASSIDKWRKLIGMKEILQFVQEAESFNELTGSEKRKYVAKRISAWAAGQGCKIPTSVMNYLIEEALQIFLEKIGHAPYPPH